MKQIFVDTSGWIALVNASDGLHRKATEVYRAKFQERCRFLTHRGIMLEVGNSLSSVNFRQTVLGLKEKIENSNRVQEIEIDDELYQAGWKLYAERLDKDWGIVDCISFVVMKKNNIAKAFTADKHFKQAGFITLL